MFILYGQSFSRRHFNKVDYINGMPDIFELSSLEPKPLYESMLEKCTIYESHECNVYIYLSRFKSVARKHVRPVH